LSAPSSAGKTASVLPAFLELCAIEDGITYYVYIAFDNNNKRNFRVQPFDPSTDGRIALNQGAAIMAECVKVVLGSPEMNGPFGIPLNASPPDISDTVPI